MSNYVYDIETSPRPRSELEPLCPTFDAPSNYKDPEKIAAVLAAKKEEWLSSAALSAVTGRVLAIGILNAETGTFEALTGDEADILQIFWNRVSPKENHGAITDSWIGFNSNRFDLPFLVRRSWVCKVEIPSTVISGRYLNQRFIDLMEVYRVCDYQASISLDALAKWLGEGAKTGNGADFAALFAKDPAAALQYLRNDVWLTARCALRLGVLDGLMPMAAAEAAQDY